MSASYSPPSRRDMRIAALGWAFCAVFFFYAFILRVAPAVMVDDLMREFAVGAAILGNLSAVYLYVYAGLQIPVGMFFDRFGLRGLVAGSCALTGLGAMVFALAETVSVAYIGRFLIGAGAAFSFVGALNMAAHWFPSRFAVLGGWAQMMGSVGGFVGQAPLGLAIASFGWRSTNFWLGAAGLVLAALLLLTVRDPVKHEGSVAARGRVRAVRLVAMNPHTWLAAVAAAGMAGTLLAFGGLWGVPFLMVARGLEKPAAAGLISLIFVGWSIGAPLIGWLSDRFAMRKPIVIVGTGVAALTTGAVILWPTAPVYALGVVLVIQGILSSSMILCYAITRENNPPEVSGAAIGLVNMLVVGSGALLQPLIGVVLDALWSGESVAGARVYALADYRLGLATLPVTCAVSMLAAMAMPEKRAKAAAPAS